jgi:prophage DNA circulation protein
MMTPEGMQSPIGVEAADEIVRLRAEVEQLESAWTFVNIWKGRYESERALADQLAEALNEVSQITKVLHGRGDMADCLIQAFLALAAHEAARKEASDE